MSHAGLPLFESVFSSVRDDLKEPRPRLDEIKRRLAGLLKHYHEGSQRQERARDLAAALGTNDRTIRQAAKELLEEGVPVISGPHGFFYAVSVEELEAYRDNLVARRSGLTRDIRAVENLMVKGVITIHADTCACPACTSPTGQQMKATLQRSTEGR